MQEEHIPQTEVIESAEVVHEVAAPIAAPVAVEVTAPIAAEVSEPSETKTNKGIIFRPNTILRAEIEKAAKENNQSVNQWLISHLESHFTGTNDAITHKLDLILELLIQKLPPAPANFQTMKEQGDAHVKAGLQALRKTLETNPPSHTPQTMVSPLSPAHKNRGF